MAIQKRFVSDWRQGVLGSLMFTFFLSGAWYTNVHDDESHTITLLQKRTAALLWEGALLQCNPRNNDLFVTCAGYLD